MIDKQELRLGSAVKIDDEEDILFIYELGRFSCQVCEKNDSILMDDFSYSDLIAVEISPDLLVQCGLEKRFPIESCNIWDMKPAPTRNGVFSLALIKSGWIFMTAPGAMPFHHIHQLQNLYYSLTGQELVLNQKNK